MDEIKSLTDAVHHTSDKIRELQHEKSKLTNKLVRELVDAGIPAFTINWRRLDQIVYGRGRRRADHD